MRNTMRPWQTFWLFSIYGCVLCRFHPLAACGNIHGKMSSKQMVIIDTNCDHVPTSGLSSTVDAYLVGDDGFGTQALRVRSRGEGI